MEEISQKMKKDWSDRAKENAYHWVDSSKKDWDKSEYYKGGVSEVEEYVLPIFKKGAIKIDALSKMRALDIGCGTGRLSVAMAKYFGKVDGVDVSEDMIDIAKRDNKDISNVDFHINNGVDLSGIKNDVYDFVFSFIVFQHIPKRSIIKNYIKEIYRVLKPGSYMQVQVRGYPGYLASGVPAYQYKGFDSFYMGVSRKKSLPVPVFHRYDTLFGAFFKDGEISDVASKIGYRNIETFYTAGNSRYLWIRAVKR